MTALVWFGMWSCHCSMVTATEDQIPAACPTHGRLLVPGVDGSRSPVSDPGPGTMLGYEPSDACPCPTHGGAR